MKPKLSIITINLNNGIGLEKTILSVNDQTFKDYEFIVIDGGSNDSSQETMNIHSNQIHYKSSENDKGVYDAQNKGLRQATGEYCLFLNSGDSLAEKSTLEKVFTKNIQCDIAYGNMLIKNPNGKLSEGKMPKTLTFHQLMTDTIWHPVSFIKRTILSERGGYDTRFKIAADYDFFLYAILIKRATTFYLDEFISVFDLNGLSSNPANAEIIAKERREAQGKYLHPIIISQFNDFLQLKSQRNTSILKRFLSLINLHK